MVQKVCEKSKLSEQKYHLVTGSKLLFKKKLCVGCVKSYMRRAMWNSQLLRSNMQLKIALTTPAQESTVITAITAETYYT